MTAQEGQRWRFPDTHTTLAGEKLVWVSSMCFGSTSLPARSWEERPGWSVAPVLVEVVQSKDGRGGLYARQYAYLLPKGNLARYRTTPHQQRLKRGERDHACMSRQYCRWRRKRKRCLRLLPVSLALPIQSNPIQARSLGFGSSRWHSYRRWHKEVVMLSAWCVSRACPKINPPCGPH